jgi:hypothetical protein
MNCNTKRSSANIFPQAAHYISKSRMWLASRGLVPLFYMIIFLILRYIEIALAIARCTYKIPAIFRIIFVDYPEEGDRKLFRNFGKKLRIDTEFCTIRFSVCQLICVNLKALIILI